MTFHRCGIMFDLIKIKDWAIASKFMKKTPRYSIELISQSDILRKLKNQFGQLPDPLDFVLEKNWALYGENWYDESALKAIEHMANDPDAHFFEVLTYLKRLTEIKDNLLKRYRLTRRTDTVRSKRIEIFKAVFPYLREVDRMWYRLPNDLDKETKDEQGNYLRPLGYLNKYDAIDETWEKRRAEIRQIPVLKKMTKGSFQKRFEEYLSVYAYLELATPERRIIKRRKKSFYFRHLDDPNAPVAPPGYHVAMCSLCIALGAVDGRVGQTCDEYSVDTVRGEFESRWGYLRDVFTPKDLGK